MLLISVCVTAFHDNFCLYVSSNKTLACNTMGHTTPSGLKNIADILRILRLVTCNLFATSTMFSNWKTKQSVLMSRLMPSTLRYFELLPNEFCTHVSSWCRMLLLGVPSNLFSLSSVTNSTKLSFVAHLRKCKFASAKHFFFIFLLVAEVQLFDSQVKVSTFVGVLLSFYWVKTGYIWNKK